jgi:spore maturation protein CgeB
MNGARLDIVILGLSITSSWGNGHATTYRALTRALARRGHRLLFLERDQPWYAGQRDLPSPSYCPTRLYPDVATLEAVHARAVAQADLVIVGSYVPDGIEVGAWACETAKGIVAFDDIDTPVTLQALSRGNCDYLTAELIGRYDLYLSFAGGPLLRRLERELGAPMARPLYCSVDPDQYYPPAKPDAPRCYDLGYMGTYSPDRQPKLERLLSEPARTWPEGRFAVAGPLYPSDIDWPANVERIEHLPPDAHRDFYNAQRCTLNLTRADMTALGYAPSVRLFEAAACATPICSDSWPGLDTFFEIGNEIIVAEGADEVLRVLRDLPEDECRRIGAAGRRRVLAHHTASHRAVELEGWFAECLRTPRWRTA